MTPKRQAQKRPPPSTYRSLFGKTGSVEHVAPPPPKVGRPAKQSSNDLGIGVDVEPPLPEPAVPESDVDDDLFDLSTFPPLEALSESFKLWCGACSWPTWLEAPRAARKNSVGKILHI